MDPVEALQRERVVAAARRWLRTPYHPEARIFGAGVDCLTLLVEVYEEAGLIPHTKLPHYPKDWHLHQDAERYLNGMLKYAAEIEGPPQPGDIVIWRFGRCFSHAGIVVSWPQIIHAWVGVGCTFEDAEACQNLAFIGENCGDKGKPRPKRFFSYWRK